MKNFSLSLWPTGLCLGSQEELATHPQLSQGLRRGCRVNGAGGKSGPTVTHVHSCHAPARPAHTQARARLADCQEASLAAVHGSHTGAWPHSSCKGLLPP